MTVRFETAVSGPGPVATFAVDDDALAAYEPWIPVDHDAPEPITDAAVAG